jgi:hypothetical protein
MKGPSVPVSPGKQPSQVLPGTWGTPVPLPSPAIWLQQTTSGRERVAQNGDSDSTPVECGRSKETVKRTDLAGFALTGAKANERQTLLDILH